MTQAPWGWDELRRALCRLRADCKRRIPIRDPFWMDDLGGLQIDYTPFVCPSDQTVQCVAANPRRVALYFYSEIGPPAIRLGPLPNITTQQGYMRVLTSSGQYWQLLPYQWGPLPAHEWYCRAESGTPTLGIWQFSRA